MSVTDDGAVRVGGQSVRVLGPGAEGGRLSVLPQGLRQQRNAVLGSGGTTVLQADPTPLRPTTQRQTTSAHATARLDLLLFATSPQLVREATGAGIDGFIVDWESRGKARRQAGEGTQINHDTLADLVRVRATTSRRVVCRINGFGPWTRGEVERAVDAGADELLLPMVRDARELDRTLGFVRGRCGLGILIETEQGVRRAAELAERPLSRVYVGLNDLRIDRGSASLFAPLVDGTVDRVRAQVGTTPFGVAGLTLPERGAPVPSRLLAAELVRLNASFTFLRRSFLADTAGRPLGPAVAAIQGSVRQLAGGSELQRMRDRRALVDVVPRDRDAA